MFASIALVLSPLLH
jgi:hypothetical protein